jgi:L-threonylcarbamoyladenylate synthase
LLCSKGIGSTFQLFHNRLYWVPMEKKTLITQDLTIAAGFLKEGLPIVFPTETVYGLGAPLFNEKAVSEIYRLKGRPSDNPLIAHVKDLAMAESLAENLPEDFYLLAEKFMPGPLTIVVQKKADISTIATAGLNTIAIRIPSHETARKLLTLFNEPLVAASANLSGKPSATCVSHVLEDFSNTLSCIIEGDFSPIGIESTVVQITDNLVTLLRPGIISSEMIEDVLHKKLLVQEATEEAPRCPGMKYRHYAPNASVILLDSMDALKTRLRPYKKQMLLSKEHLVGIPIPWKFLSEKTLYAALRSADLGKTDEILVFVDEEIAKKKGLMNRLERAAR